MGNAANRLFSGLLAGLFLFALAPALAAQEQGDDGPATNVHEIIRVDVAAEDEADFEAGVQQYMSDLQDLGADWTWFAWSTLTGKHAGSYWFGTFGHSWADFDEQQLSDPEAARESFQQNVAPYVQQDHVGFWRTAEGLSRLDPAADEGLPPMLTTVSFYHVKFGKEDAFTNAIQQVKRYADEADHSEYWEVYRLQFGGGGVWAFATGHENFADLAEPDPNLAQIIEEATSEYETRQLWSQFTGSVESMHTEVLRFREDLSMIPGMESDSEQ